jgi:DNA polymerase III delta prime subunit
MTDILLHPKTKQSVEQTLKSRPHALLLTGELGAGKYTVASYIVGELLGVKVEAAPYVLVVKAAGKAIGIEQIRELQKFLQLKTTGNKTIRRAIILDDADTMTTEAQNALLKILEEPPDDTVLLLTASKPHQLKPTIHSRVQILSVLPPSKADILDYFISKGFNGTEIDKAYMLSNGQVGLFTALLQSKNDNTLVQQIEYAKKIYGMSTFDRLTKVEELSKDKSSLAEFLFACKRICSTALKQAALKGQRKAVETWYKQLSLIITTEESLKYNPNTKLLLTDLFLNI